MNNSGNGKTLREIYDLLTLATPREQEVIKFRYGIPRISEKNENMPVSEVCDKSGCEAHTLEETAEKFEISVERVEQIDKRLMQRIPRRRIPKVLLDYLE